MRSPALSPFDAVVVDLYSRLEAPAFVDDPAFMGGCLAALAPGGLVVVNVADAPGLTRLRAQGRALARADPGAELLVAGDPSVVSGADEGNAVLVAAPDGLPDGARRSARRGRTVPGEPSSPGTASTSRCGARADLGR